jgi:RNA polymerase sigma-70 factor (ECF subfamily)
MVSPAPSDAQLAAAAAAAGDRAALERLLLNHYDELESRIASKLPPRLAATHAAEDILQVTFFQAFRDIGRYQARADASFSDWLARIADHRLLDAIKQHDCAKRGGQWQRLGEIAPGDSRSASLLDWIAADQTSPTSAVARSEALHALQVALASIPEDQRKAIRLRHLEGKSLEEAAAAMGRSPDAVRGLVQRGKQSLAEAMGRASRWLSTK